MSAIVTCPSCGQKNRVRPHASSTPRCAACATTLPWLVDANTETFEAEVRSSVPVLVDLWAPWCGPCRHMTPILENLAKEKAGQLKIIKVNVDDNPLLASRFQANSIPLMLLFQGGEVKERIVGALPKPALAKRIQSYLSA